MEVQNSGISTWRTDNDAPLLFVVCKMYWDLEWNTSHGDFSVSDSTDSTVIPSSGYRAPFNMKHWRVRSHWPNLSRLLLGTCVLHDSCGTTKPGTPLRGSSGELRRWILCKELSSNFNDNAIEIFGWCQREIVSCSVYERCLMMCTMYCSIILDISLCERCPMMFYDIRYLSVWAMPNDVHHALFYYTRYLSVWTMPNDVHHALFYYTRYLSVWTMPNDVHHALFYYTRYLSVWMMPNDVHHALFYYTRYLSVWMMPNDVHHALFYYTRYLSVWMMPNDVHHALFYYTRYLSVWTMPNDVHHALFYYTRYLSVWTMPNDVHHALFYYTV